jgi:hypothetical protein
MRDTTVSYEIWREHYSGNVDPMADEIKHLFTAFTLGFEGVFRGDQFAIKSRRAFSTQEIIDEFTKSIGCFILRSIDRVPIATNSPLHVPPIMVRYAYVPRARLWLRSPEISSNSPILPLSSANHPARVF